MAQPTEPNELAIIVPVAAAVIAASAAIFVAAISFLSQRSARKAEELSRRKLRKAEHLRMQLDGLYGEMFLLRSTSSRLWSRLHEGNSPFRLIDSIVEIQEETSELRRSRVKQILKINARLAELIETRASLLDELPPPESFMAFLDHQRALETLWELKQDAQPGEREPSFPRSLDADIKSAIDEIQKRLRDLDD